MERTEIGAAPDVNVLKFDFWNVIPLIHQTPALRKPPERPGQFGVPDRDLSTGLDQSSSAPLTPDRTDAPHYLTTATSPLAHAWLQPTRDMICLKFSCKSARRLSSEYGNIHLISDAHGQQLSSHPRGKWT